MSPRCSRCPLPEQRHIRNADTWNRRLSQAAVSCRVCRGLAGRRSCWEFRWFIRKRPMTPDFTTASRLKAADTSGLLNFGSHPTQPLRSHTLSDSVVFSLISYSMVAGGSCFIFPGCSSQIDCENKRRRCTQVTAPVSAALLTRFIIYPSCCASRLEVLRGFFAARGTMNLLNWTKWKQGALGLLLIMAKSFFFLFAKIWVCHHKWFQSENTAISLSLMVVLLMQYI